MPRRVPSRVPPSHPSRGPTAGQRAARSISAPTFPNSSGWTGAERLALALITLAAVFLRLVRPGHSPPGLGQDEAVNAWDAWCLLRTGHDMGGQSWPVFYSHAIGDNRTTLYLYLLLPFQALGGLSVATTRLPARLAGVACVPLAAHVGRRIGGPAVGLVAAVLMAFDPWHLFVSRWGIEGSVCPFLALAMMAL